MFIKKLFGRREKIATSSLPLAGVRVMIVEDEALVALEIRDIVTDLGGIVTAIAHHPEQALAKLHETEIDCAILDVNLAGTLSYQVGAALRKRNIPFVYCTAYADAASVFPPIASAPRLGKPVQREELRETLARVLASHRDSSAEFQEPCAMYSFI